MPFAHALALAAALTLKPTGYVEVAYSHNANAPSNGLTNFRGFDNRHGTFTLSNVAAGADWEAGPTSGRLILQVGHTPSTYYLGEPSQAGAGGANASSAELWKYVQEAFVGWKAPVGRGLLVQAGLMASPIGFESFAVKDNWNWSRSNLFFGLPFYHAGVRATYAWTDELSTTVGVWNGWNAVVDGNAPKSVQASVAWKRADRFLVQALYFGGVERPTGAPEGPWWRHQRGRRRAGRSNRLARPGGAGRSRLGAEPLRHGVVGGWRGVRAGKAAELAVALGARRQVPRAGARRERARLLGRLGLGELGDADDRPSSARQPLGARRGAPRRGRSAALLPRARGGRRIGDRALRPERHVPEHPHPRSHGVVLTGFGQLGRGPYGFLTRRGPALTAPHTPRAAR